MTTKQLDEEAIFHMARSIATPEARGQCLAQVCGDDAALRSRIEALLHVHDREHSFLKPAAPGVEATIDEPIREAPGTVIGPYKLLQQIGEGGMGVVFMAEQTHPVQRKVALKVIKPGMDSRQVIARFEAERQALAMMDHVNIARVLDAGATESGRPYFVMELVHGVPITKYCDDNHLTPRERLELFVPVCQAIQHAHQKGIIHRDIKPSNVMITLYDGKPVPKVIDFGVAKATEQKLTERTLFTQYGTMVGTLEYMSPEQAEMSALGVDTRSDIFSLGVLLYELLTGSTPLSHKRVKEAAYGEVLRMIKEEEPPKPSTRLSDSGESLASISAQRHMEPAKLTKLVRGELDWIVMKTLEKDRNRRYETANGFAADVQRYLNDEPVQACPPSAVYRFRKFARRNKRILTTASLVCLTLVLGTAVSMWQAFRATHAEGLAGERLETANANYQTAEEQRQRAEASEREAKTKEELAKDAQKQSAESLKDALAAVDLMLTRVAQERLANVPQMEPVRRELMQDALKFYQKFLQQNRDDPLIRRETALAYRRLAEIHHNLGQYAEAETGYHKAFAMFAELEAQSPLEPSTRRDLSVAHLELANCLDHQGKREEQASSVHQGVEIAEQLVKEYPNDPNDIDRLVDATFTLAGLIGLTRPEEAENMLRRNLTLTNTPYLRANIFRYLGVLLTNQGRSREGEQATRKALEEYEKLASDNASSNWLQACKGETLYQLATLVAADSRLQEADEICGRAISVLDKLATDYPAGPIYRNSQAWAHQGRAALLRKLHRTAEAEQAYRKALNLFVKLAADFPTLSEYPQTAFDQRLNLGQFLMEAGQEEDALNVYRQAVDLPVNMAADAPTKLNHWLGLVRTHLELGGLLAKAGKQEQAKTAYLQAAEIQDKLEMDFADKAEVRRDLAQSHYQAALLFRDAGRPLETEKFFGYAIRHFRKLMTEFPKAPEYRANMAYSHNELGWLMRRANSGRLPQAETEHRRSLALFEELATEFPTEIHYQSERAEVLQTIACLLRDRGDLAEAKPLMEAATTYARGVLQAAPQRIYRERFRRDHLDLANLLVQLGESAAAEKSLRQALADCEKQVAESPAEPDSRKALAETRIDLAHFLNNAGQPQDSEPLYRLALESYDKLATDAPTNLNHWQGLVRSHIELGGLLANGGKKEEAETFYRRAAEIEQKLEQDFADNADVRRDLAQIHYQAANLFRDAGRPVEAENLYDYSIAHFHKLVTEFPAVPEHRRNLANVHYDLGVLLQSKARLPEAEIEQRQALPLFEQLSDEFPTVAWRQRERAELLRAMGILLRDQGDVTGAQRFLERATVYAQKAFNLDPYNPAFGERLRRDRKELANLLIQLGESAAAENVYREALAAAEQLVAEHPEMLSYANQAAQIRAELAVLLGESEKVVRLIWFPRFSPDGKWLLSAHGSWDTNEGGEVRKFTVQDGAEQYVLKHRNGVRSVAWSSQGTFFVTGGYEGVVRFFDPQNGKQLYQLYAGGEVENVRISPDDKLLITSHDSGDVRMYELPSRKELHTFKAAHVGGIWGMAISPNGKLAATTGKDGFVRIIDLDARKIVHEFKHPNETNGVAFTPDGRHLATGCVDSLIRIFDVRTGEEQAQLKGHDSGPVTDLQFNSYGKLLASAGGDCTIRLWDVSNLERATLIRTLRGHTSIVFGVAISPDDRSLASVGWDEQVKMWDLKTGEVRWTKADAKPKVIEKRRGQLLADQEKWKEAAAAFSRAIELCSDDLEGVWLPLALLQLKAGQTDDYRRLVSAALARFGQTEELGVATNLAILAKLAPGSPDELAAILQILERTLAHKPGDGLAVAIRAHLLIRAGRAADVVPLLEAMVAAIPDGQGDQRFNLLFLAMGRKQLGRDAEALEAFRAAERWQDKRFNAWFNQVDFDRTRDELAAMLGMSEMPPK